MRGALTCSALLISSTVVAFACSSSTPRASTKEPKTDDTGVTETTDDVGDAGEAPAGGWKEVAYPDGATDLKAFAAIPGGEIFAVGKKGVADALFHYDGKKWETLDVGAEVGTGYGAVWAASNTEVFAASSGPATAFVYDGTAWTPSALTPKTANTLFGIGPTDVWLGTQAASGEDAVYRYNGKSWVPVTGLAGAGNVTSMWATDTSDLWAINSGKLLRYNGISWKAVTTANSDATPTVRSVSGSSKDDVWIVGLAGECEHFDGSAWTSFDVGTDDLNGVYTESTTSAWAVGLGILSQWNGTEWIDATTLAGAPAGGTRVTGTSDGDVWVWDGTNEGFYHYVK